jgi:hypothetical protein
MLIKIVWYGKYCLSWNHERRGIVDKFSSAGEVGLLFLRQDVCVFTSKFCYAAFQQVVQARQDSQAERPKLLCFV